MDIDAARAHIKRIRELLDNALVDFDYEYDYGFNKDFTIDVEIEGSTKEFEIERESSVSLSCRELADDTIPSAFRAINETISALDEMLLAEPPPPEPEPVPPRKPWPGSYQGHAYTSPFFAAEYDPPTGYQYTGEYRPWKAGEIFLGNMGGVAHASGDGDRRRHRHILFPEISTKPPSKGYTRTVGRALAVEPEAEAEPPVVEATAPIPETTAPEPRSSLFEPPRKPEPV